MQEAVEERDRGRLHRQKMTPVFKWPMASNAQAATLVGGGDETKERLRTGVVVGSEPELVDQNQLVAQQNADDLAHGVVGQTAVQRFDQVGGNDIADLHTALGCTCAAPDQGMAFAGTAGSNE